MPLLLRFIKYFLLQFFFFLSHVRPYPLQSVQTLAVPKFINTTFYSTSPRISYGPESQCAGGILGGCGKRYDPWEPVSYTSTDGTVETFFRTSNWQNLPNSDQARRVSFGFRGTAVYLYGAPRKHLQYQPGLHEVCLGLSCTTLRVDEIYAAFGGPEDEPVLLWHQEGITQPAHHELHFRFQEPSSPSLLGMTFHHLVLTETAPEERSKWKLKDDEEFFDLTYEDTNPRILYSPSGPNGPWELSIFTPDGEHNYSFHRTSSWGHQPNGDGIRTISWSFKGAALSVYGAPKNHLQYDPGHAELCLNGRCYPIDSARIYNNFVSPDEPVLLFFYELLDPGALSLVTLRFLQKESPIADTQKGLTFYKAVFTQIRKKSRIAPGTTFTKHTVLDDSVFLKFLPTEVCSSWFLGYCTGTFSPWTRESYPTLLGINASYHRTSTWKNELSGDNNWRAIYELSNSISTVELYGAPRSRLIHPPGIQEACLDGECYPIDVAQAYLNVDPDNEHDPVLIWSMDGLNLLHTYTFTMRLMDQTEDGDRNVRGMTFAELVYWVQRRPGLPPAPGETTSTFISRSTTSTSSARTTTAISVPSTTSTSRTSTTSLQSTSIPKATPTTISRVTSSSTSLSKTSKSKTTSTSASRTTSSPTSLVAPSSMSLSKITTSSTSIPTTTTTTSTPHITSSRNTRSTTLLRTMTHLTTTSTSLSHSTTALSTTMLFTTSTITTTTTTFIPIHPLPPPKASRTKNKHSSASTAPIATHSDPPTLDPSPTNPTLLRFILSAIVALQFTVIVRLLKSRLDNIEMGDQDSETESLLPDDIAPMPAPKPNEHGGFTPPTSPTSTASSSGSNGHLPPIQDDIQPTFPTPSDPDEQLVANREDIAKLTNSAIRKLPSKDIVSIIHSVTENTIPLPSGRNKQRQRADLETLLRAIRTQERARIEERRREEREAAVARGQEQSRNEQRLLIQLADERRRLEEAESRQAEERENLTRRAHEQEQARLELEARLLEERLRVQQLEQQRLQQEQDIRRARDCVICQDREATFSLLDCGHLCVCQECSAQVLGSAQPRCPICRSRVRTAMRIFPS